MKTLLKYVLLSVSLSLTAIPSAHAVKHDPVTASEVDLSLAISGLTLLAGALAVVHVRRSKG